MPKSKPGEYKPVVLRPLSKVGSKTKITNTGMSKSKDEIPGGKGDNRPDSDFDPKQLKAGVKIELEHTNDKDKAKEIAKDHLTESKDYYEKLIVMERKLEKSEDESQGELIKEHKRLVHVLKTPSHKDDKQEAKKQGKELKNLESGKEYKPVNKSLQKIHDVTKALMASAASSLARRARAEAAVAENPARPEFRAEVAEVRDIGVGYTRPLHEPPVVPIRRVETPNPVPARKCEDHTYRTYETGPQEAKPIKDR